MSRLFGFCLFLLCAGVLGNDSAADTPLALPTEMKVNLRNRSSDPSTGITMNGHTNYNAAQQIFYIYGPQSWRMRSIEAASEKSRKDDYVFTPGVGAHKLHPEKLPWNKARRYCIDEGGHLAIVNSAAEEKVLLSLLADEDKPCGWLGVHDLYEEGDWATVLNQELGSTGYTRWTTVYRNQPDNYGGNQNCGLLMREGGMDDNSCSAAVSFFCEIPLNPDSYA